MNDDSDMLREIEVHETWLRQAMPVDSPPSLAPLKLLVRVAVNEAWLARTAGDAGAAPDLDCVKQAVRGELTRAKPPKAAQPRRWTLWGGGLAAAAAILLGVLMFRQVGPGNSGPGMTAVAPNLDDWIVDMQESVPISEEAETKWEELAADVVSLEENLADSGRWAWSEDEFDELGGELETLVDEITEG